MWGWFLAGLLAGWVTSLAAIGILAVRAIRTVAENRMMQKAAQRHG